MVTHFVERAARRFGLPRLSPSLQDLRQSRAYPWPGNVRELAAVIDRAAILGEGQRLDIAGALGAGVSDSVAPVVSLFRGEQPSESNSILPLDDVIRRHIETALQAAKGRVEGPFGAAALLDINPQHFALACVNWGSTGNNFVSRCKVCWLLSIRASGGGYVWQLQLRPSGPLQP